MNKTFTTCIDGQPDLLIEMFKDIHQSPQLGFMEIRTAEKELRTHGYNVKTGNVGVMDEPVWKQNGNTIAPLLRCFAPPGKCGR